MNAHADVPCPLPATWSAFLDAGDAAPDAHLDTHLAACPACQATLERLTALPTADADAASANKPLGRLRGLIRTGDAPPPGRAADPSLPHVPGYEIHRELGRGGLGVVYEAYHLRLGRTVAIKRMKSWATATPEQLVRFNSDAKFLARLRHPGVIEIYESALYDGQPYSVLECVVGGSLVDVLPGEPLHPGDVVPFMARVARTVAHLHAHGVLHCDVKPGNVLLDTPPGVGPHRLAGRRPKVIDFGLAEYRDHDVQLTRAADVIGTPQYMAPEMLDGRNAGASVAADIYSTGAVLYEMVAARPPATGSTRSQIIDSVRTGRPSPPSAYRADGDASLDAVCLRCLERDPARRYPSAEALADALEAIGRPAGPRAAAPSTDELLRRLAVAAGHLRAAHETIDALCRITDPDSAKAAREQFDARLAVLD